MKKLLLGVWMGMLLCGYSTVSLAVESVIATVPTAAGPNNIAINPVTNKIYVANAVSYDPYGNYIWGNTVTVIDGATNNTSTVEVGTYPRAITVNPVTNKIYVANYYSYTISVIDGDTDTVINTISADSPNAIAVNTVTNMIYATSSYGDFVTVIDGNTNYVTTVPSGGGLFSNTYGIAIDSLANKIYVLHGGGPWWDPINSVMVLDGATNTSIDVPVGYEPIYIAVNPVTNKIYMAAYNGRISVMDGATYSVTHFPAGNVFSLTVNPATNRIYVGGGGVTVIDGDTNDMTSFAPPGASIAVAIAFNSTTNDVYVLNQDYYYNSNVMIIDHATNTTSSVEVGFRPTAIAVNSVTNRTYVSNTRDNTVSVIGELNPDTTPPVISSNQTPLANSNGWNNTDVTVTFTATDDVSTPTCTVNSAVLTSESAGQSVSTTCIDAAGNSANATVSDINIDKTAPMLTMPSLASNYTVGSSAMFSFSATDTLSGLASVSATLNGNPVSSGSTEVLNQLGSNTFTLAATDKAGNSVTQTVIFSVVYGFGGFLPPLTADSRTNFHLGSVIPVKFDLVDASGAAVSTAVARLSLQKLFNGDPIGDPIDATPTGGADSGNLFRYNGGHYAYNLSTKPFTAGIWRIQATLDDGTVRTIDIGLTSK